MNLHLVPMDIDSAVEISGWTYQPPYDFYNMGHDKEVIDELLNGTYFKCVDDHQGLAGFCCFGHSATVPIGVEHGAYPENGAVDIGLGMRPDCTGHGRGFGFVGSILEFAQTQFEAKLFRLTVATFNKRAITLYKKLGFAPVMVFPMGDVEFTTMERTATLSLFIGIARRGRMRHER